MVNHHLVNVHLSKAQLHLSVNSTRPIGISFEIKVCL